MPPNKKARGDEAQLTGAIIAKLVATGDLDEICPPYKAKHAKGKTEHVLYRPFSGNATLARRYLAESPGAAELLHLLANAGRDDKLNLQAMSLLLFIAQKCKPEEPDGRDPLGHSVLPVLKKRLKELSKGSAAVVKYALRLTLQCVEEAKTGALREFVEGGEFYRFLLTVNNPGGTDYQLAFQYFYRRFGDDPELAEDEPRDEFADEAELEHNGELVNTLLLLLALRGVDVFASQNLAHLVHQNFKHENAYAKIFTLKALLAVVNNKLDETRREDMTEKETAFIVNLLTNVNNNLVKIVNADEAEPEKRSGHSHSLYNRLVCELLAVAERFDPELAPAFVKKYSVGAVQRFISQVWRATPRAYEAYVEGLGDTVLAKREGAEAEAGRAREEATHLRAGAGAGLRALVLVLSDCLGRLRKLPKFADKGFFNAVLKLKNVAVANAVLGLFTALVEAGVAGPLLDLNTLINLSPTAYLPRGNAARDQSEALEYTLAWLVLMRKFAKRANAARKVVYDFFKLFGLELVSACYRAVTRALLDGARLQTDAARRALEVDAALSRCVFHAGVNGTLKAAERYLLPLLLRLAALNGYLGAHEERAADRPEAERYRNKLAKYVGAIFAGVGCEPTPRLTANVRDAAGGVAVLVLYRIVVKHNTSILFNFALPRVAADEQGPGAELVCVTCAGRREPDALHALLRNLQAQLPVFQDGGAGAKFLACRQCGGRYLNLARAANAELDAVLASGEAAALLPFYDAEAATVRAAFPGALGQFLEQFFAGGESTPPAEATEPEPQASTRRRPQPAQLKGLLDDFAARKSPKETITKLNLLLADAASLPELANAEAFELVLSVLGRFRSCEGQCDPLSCENVLLCNALNLAARHLEQAATPALCERLLCDPGFENACHRALKIRWHFVGFCVETALKLAGARALKLALGGLGGARRAKTRQTLPRYFAVAAGAYNCTPADEDRLLRDCIFRLSALLSDDADERNSHFKLPVTIRSLRLAAVNLPGLEETPTLATHGCANKWGVYDKCFIFRRPKYPNKLLPDRNVVDEARLRATEGEDGHLADAEVKQLADRFGVTETRRAELDVGDTRCFFDALAKWAAAGAPRSLPNATMEFLDAAFMHFTSQPPPQVGLNLRACAYDLKYLAAHVSRLMALAYFNARCAKRYLFHGDAPNERGLDQIYRVIWLCSDRKAVSAEKLEELCGFFTALDEGNPPHESLLEKIVLGGRHARILPQTNYVMQQTLECFRTLSG